MNPPRNAPSSPPDTLAADRPHQVSVAHLSKLALVYIRQSSPKQVRDNTGSTEDQRALAQLARHWGWPEGRIRVVDHDLGLSARTADRRSGFQNMLELFEQGTVGIVFVRDVMRLSRDPLVSEMFLTKAIRAGVLIYALGRVFDTATEDLAELFGLRIQSLLGWFENKSRARQMAGAKAAMVRQGFAVAGRPIGYIRIVRGKWAKDPDPDVRDSIQRVFDLALEGYSIGKLIRYMKEHQLRFPRRFRDQLVWEPPARSSIANLLSNPNYTPDYHYRRRRDVAATTKRGFRAVLRPDTEWLVYRGHHEGYLSCEQWQSLQEALRSRQPRNRPPLGKGSALLQGLVWCHQCDRWMSTMYHRRRDAERLPSYLCRRVDRWGRTAHYMVGAAEVVDGLVTKHVLASLATVDHETALRVLEDAQADQRALRGHQQRLLQRAEAVVVTAREQYTAVSPEHQRVRADLGAVYEEAIQRRDEIKDMIEPAVEPPALVFSSEDAVQFAALTEQLNTLWEASTTSNEDRKQLLRLVLDRVVVLTSTNEEIALELVWAGGLREPLQVQRRAELDAQVRRLRQANTTPQAIIGALQSAGIPSPTGKPASKDVVRRSLERVGLNREAIRFGILRRIRELALEGHNRRRIMQVLDQECPLPDARRWTHDRLYRAVQRLRKGVPGLEPLPVELLDKPDMAPVRARVEQARREGRTWKQIAADLNAAGLRPVKAARFSLFQVMELMRRRPHRAHPGKGPARTPRPSNRP